jgi:hypothetical protein
MYAQPRLFCFHLTRKQVAERPPPAQEVGLQPTASNSSSTSTPHSLTHSFNTMSLNNAPQPFVGGFLPSTTPAPPPGPLPRPPAMPMPMHNIPANSQPSLTMQYAMHLSPQQHSPARPVSAPGMQPPWPFPPAPSGSSLPGTPQKPALSPLTQPNRPRAASTPPSPSSATSIPNQCCGVTKTGKRCTRQVKSGPAYASVFRDDTSVEKFCFQHTKELLNPTGFYARSRSQPDKNNSEWIEFIGNTFLAERLDN